MNVLLIGSGAREHAIAWKLSQSPLLTNLFVAPGSSGIAQTPKTENLDIQPQQFKELVEFAKEKQIKLTIVGPEQPLADGIVDAFTQEGLVIFGPNQKGAQIEASKIFAKELMLEANIPTAKSHIFENKDDLDAFLNQAQYPLVIKADGLASGKGVSVCSTQEEALAFGMLIFEEKKFGAAGNKVLVEECLKGRECSILAITDGKSITLLESAQDHKRLLDGDQGPNTGGMGAYSPSPIFDPSMKQNVMQTIFQPLLHTLQKRNIDYCGVIYAGLMITDQGPYVLEFNARFGDPETQVILARLETDLLALLLAATQKKLDQMNLEWSKDHAVTIVMASKDYPNKSQSGTNLYFTKTLPDHTIVFHAGTQLNQNQWQVHGGRVLSVTTLSSSIADARKLGYQSIESIQFEGAQYRSDIGQDA